MSELVYVIGSEENGSPFKIGKSKTKSLKSRIKTLQTGNPLTLKSFYEFTPKDGNAYILESNIRNELVHNYGYKKLKGEWIHTDDKKSIEKIGNDISKILKKIDYDFADDPRYDLLIEHERTMNNKLEDMYDDLLEQHKSIFEQLKVFDSAYKKIKNLHTEYDNLNSKISKYKKTNDYNNVNCYESRVEKLVGMHWYRVEVNAIKWLMRIYNLVKNKAHPAIHHRQGSSFLEIPEDGYVYITLDNQRFEYDVKNNRLTYKTPVQRDCPSLFGGGITGKHYIDKADLYRYYDRENNAFHDDINLGVDERFKETRLRSCRINYNNKSYNFINEDFISKGKKIHESI